jgi:hypothetical protein
MASDFSFGIFQLFLESGVLFKNVCGSSDLKNLNNYSQNWHVSLQLLSFLNGCE